MDLNLNDIMESVTELADSAVKLAKDVASKTGKKTEEIVGVSKNKLDTLKLENDIKATKGKLGSAVYEMAVDGAVDTGLVDKYVAEIKMKYEQLEVLKKQAEAMKKTVVCPACKSINSKESYFCSRCGAALPTPVDDTVFAAEEEYVEDDSMFVTEDEIIDAAEVDGADAAQAQEVADEAAAE